MRQAFLIALLLVVLSVFGKTLGAATGASEILDQARTLVANREYQKAAALLEEGLPGSPPADRGDMIGLLRQAYQNLINQAEASGKAREAAEYRDNLAILEQVPARPSVNAASPNPAHAPDPSPALPASAATDPRPQPADSLPYSPIVREPRSRTVQGTELTAGTRSLTGPRGPRFGRHRFSSGHPATEQGPGSRHSGSAGRGRDPGARQCDHSSQSGRRASFPVRTRRRDARRVDPALEFKFTTGPGGSMVHGQEIRRGGPGLRTPRRCRISFRSSASRSGHTVAGLLWSRSSMPIPTRTGSGMTSNRRSAASSG